MPIYEYTCDSCGKVFEALVPNARTKSTCPACGSDKLTRQFSTFAAHGSPATPGCADCCSLSQGGCPSMGACPGAR